MNIREPIVFTYNIVISINDVRVMLKENPNHRNGIWMQNSGHLLTMTHKYPRLYVYVIIIAVNHILA